MYTQTYNSYPLSFLYVVLLLHLVRLLSDFPAHSWHPTPECILVIMPIGDCLYSVELYVYWPMLLYMQSETIDGETRKKRGGGIESRLEGACLGARVSKPNCVLCMRNTMQTDWGERGIEDLQRVHYVAEELHHCQRIHTSDKYHNKIQRKLSVPYCRQYPE